MARGMPPIEAELDGQGGVDLAEPDLEVEAHVEDAGGLHVDTDRLALDAREIGVRARRRVQRVPERARQKPEGTVLEQALSRRDEPRGVLRGEALDVGERDLHRRLVEQPRLIGDPHADGDLRARLEVEQRAVRHRKGPAECVDLECLRAVGGRRLHDVEAQGIARVRIGRLRDGDDATDGGALRQRLVESAHRERGCLVDIVEVDLHLGESGQAIVVGQLDLQREDRAGLEVERRRVRDHEAPGDRVEAEGAIGVARPHAHRRDDPVGIGTGERADGHTGRRVLGDAQRTRRRRGGQARIDVADDEQRGATIRDPAGRAPAPRRVGGGLPRGLWGGQHVVGVAHDDERCTPARQTADAVGRKRDRDRPGREVEDLDAADTLAQRVEVDGQAGGTPEQQGVLAPAAVDPDRSGIHHGDHVVAGTAREDVGAPPRPPGSRGPARPRADQRPGHP